MSDDGIEHERRRSQLAALLDVAAGDPDSGGDRLRRVCALAVSEVGVSGAGITVMAGLDGGLAGSRDQLCATGPVSGRLEALQLTTGEGPCLDAYAAGAPVLVADLARDASRWLGFAPEALLAGAAAVFSFPLQVGAVRLGTLDLYRDAPGSLGRAQLADALVLAGLATEIVLGLTAPEPESDHDVRRSRSNGNGAVATGDGMGWLPGVHAQVHQASGMVSGAEGIPVDKALLRIRAHAFAHGIPIEQVARRIVDRELTLDPDDDQRDGGSPWPDLQEDR